MRGRNRRAVWLVVLVAAAGCAEEEDAIVLDSGIVRVTNQTPDEWSNVEVWVNQHYRAVTPRLEPGGRFAARLDAFVAGFGQRFQRGRQSVYLIEVKARRGNRQPVRLVWREGKYEGGT